MENQLNLLFAEQILESQIDPSELSDICINKGILQEANRSFFNPLGFVLQLQGSHLILLKSNKEGGPIIDSIDKMQSIAFRNYAFIQHNLRSKFYGFIIQVKDILRSKDITHPIADPKMLRLRVLLTALDQIIFLCKEKFMSKSKEKDINTLPMSEDQLYSKLEKNLAENDYIDVINYISMIAQIHIINSELNRLNALPKKIED